MTAVLIGVTLISTLGWLLSLAWPQSAVRRHLLLMTALVACLALPVAVAVRQYTNWTLVTVRVAGPSAPVLDERRVRVDDAAAGNAEPHDGQADERERIRTDHALPNGAGKPARAADAPEGTDVSAAAPPAIVSPRPVHDSGQPDPAQIDAWQVARLSAIGLYVLVAGGLALRLLARLAATERLRRRASFVETLTGGVQVLEAHIAVPVAIGFGPPAIVLPVGFRDSVAADQFNDVVRHERAHLARRDHWVMLLQGVAAAAYWPIVTVHLLNRALGRAREDLCDNAAIGGRHPVDYGRTLLAVAERFGEQSRRSALPPLGSSIIGRGDLERRIAGLLDDRRDRRSRASRPVRWTIVGAVLMLVALMGSARVVAVAEGKDGKSDPKANATEVVGREAGDKVPAANANIAWTGIPKVSLEDPTLHRGVVLGPDSKPVAGASIYAASTIELFEMNKQDNVSTQDLGPVRAVTDDLGRFEFQAPDLSWVPLDGKRKRWETLLVATTEGLAPGWLKTWGEDRSFREHWHPWREREVAIPLRTPATLTGRFLLEGGEPLAGANVRLTGLMAPVEYDLEKHIPKEEVRPLGMFSGVDYAETIYWPQVLPGLVTTVAADAEGRFELPGLPEGFIAQIEVTHPKAVTTTLRVAIRAIEPVYREGFRGGKAELSLYGSGFTAELPPGAVLRGEVASGWISSSRPAPGVIVALANQNSPDGMSGQQFKTDAKGRFEVTGLPNWPQGFQLAFVGSYDAPVTSDRKLVVPGEDMRVTLTPAVRYRLKLTDASGQPIDREVSSIYVQRTPGEMRRDVKSRFNDAQRVGPGVYEGIVPQGTGAVVVKRGTQRDRPAAVDPKAYFEPDRSDWTLEEQRFAYGDAWGIAVPAVVTHNELSAGNRMENQFDLAAVVFTTTDSSDEDAVLELAATIYTDPPVAFELVDEAGAPVEGAVVSRQFKKYDGKDLPATFEVNGLHPTRAEFFEFTEPKRDLIGTVRTTWTKDKVRVVMRPAAHLKGRLVKKSSQPDLDFGVRVLGEGIPPDTYRAGSTMQEPRGTFEIAVPPGLEVRGEFVRKFPDWKLRPSTGAAFGPLTPEAGATIDLGDLQVP